MGFGLVQNESQFVDEILMIKITFCAALPCRSIGGNAFEVPDTSLGASQYRKTRKSVPSLSQTLPRLNCKHKQL